MMQRFVLFLLGCCLMGSTGASSMVALDRANIDLTDRAALQSGAKYFVNYCLGCHSLQFHRYENLVDDLGLTEQQLQENFLVGAQTPTDPITNSMLATDAENWFGAPPPDLSVIARSRGVDWLYTFLHSFYLDDSRPLGVNNTVFDKVGMPHVLWQLQGWQTLDHHISTDANGHEHETAQLKLVEAGTLTSPEYDQVVREIVSFLAYVGEPVQIERKRIGLFVLGFLALLALVAYLLKREFWKDVH